MIGLSPTAGEWLGHDGGPRLLPPNPENGAVSLR